MSFSKYANPVLGALPVSEVSSADVLSVLTPIWSSKHETATRVRQRIGAVMDWAVAQGYRLDNPAGTALNRVLPRLPKTMAHHPSVPYSEIPLALKQVWESDAWLTTKLSLEFMVLTAARSTEVRHAAWAEVNWDSATWTVPPERMKGRKGERREHRVPLADRALSILAEARNLKDGIGLIFPSPRSGKPISDMTHRNLMRKLGLRDEKGELAVPHGFRASFRVWGAEQTNLAEELMEAALAHAKGDATEAAYARSDLFERRRQLMDAWAEYLAGGGGVNR